MISTILNAASGPRALAAVVVLIVGGFFLFQFGPYPVVKTAAGETALPEEKVTTPAELGQFLVDVGEDGRAAYTRFQVLDLFNPFLLGTASAFMLAWLLGRTHKRETGWRRVLYFPLILAGSDILENVVLGIAVIRFPATALTTPLLPVATGVKLAALAGTMFTVLFLVINAGWLWLRGRTSA